MSAPWCTQSRERRECTVSSANLSEEFVESRSNFISRDEGDADQNSMMERDLELGDESNVVEPSDSALPTL